MKDQADLVLEGGGVKGVGLVGAVSRLDRKFVFERVAGTSVGALVAALIAAGVTGDDIETTLMSFPFPAVPRRDAVDQIPILGPLAKLLFARGVFLTSFVRDWVATQLERRNVRTFGDLRHDKSDWMSEERRYKLVVTATDVTSGELLYLPWDYRKHFGRDPDEQPVADAVAASIAIPLYFEPVVLTDVRTNESHVLVDGGVLSNFPITVFDRTDGRQPDWPTFGVKIIPPLPARIADVIPVAGRLPLAGIQQLGAVIATMIVGRDQTYLERPCVAARTIQVDTDGVGLVDFGVDDRRKKMLFDNGWTAADQFLASWNFGNYKALCRPPNVASASPSG
jgi:NTE family protein